jgi:hypothetical protein
MKKLLICILALAMLPLFGCRKDSSAIKIIPCDGCGKKIEFPVDSNVTEDWIILCDECNEKVDRD